MNPFNPIRRQFLIVPSFLAFQAMAFGAPIAFDAPNKITGRVIGPIVSGQVDTDTQVKAYHLKTDRPLLLDDAASTCGPQRIQSLPILSEGMVRYKNQRVRVSASIQCVESKLGSYAIDQVHDIKMIK